MQLANAMNGILMVGEMINHHPQAGLFQQLLQLIADLSNNQLVYLPEANEKAQHIAQTQPVDNNEHVSQYWQQCLRAYLLLGVEPELDTAQPQFAKHALEKASFVVAVNSFDSPAIRAYADVILPMACFAETSGTFVGLDGTWQSFAGAVPARGESRPAWKILRVLGNISALNGFDYVSSQEVKEDIQQGLNLQASPSITKQEVPAELNIESSLMLISEVPSYRSDALVRHSEALQKTAAVQLAQSARINTPEAEKRGLKNGDMITITQALYRCEVPLVVDDGIADDCIYLAAATEAMARLGMMYGRVDVEVVQ
jgi:NADH-quinone oxidoreductase subunit G